MRVQAERAQRLTDSVTNAEAARALYRRRRRSHAAEDLENGGSKSAIPSGGGAKRGVKAVATFSNLAW